MKQAIPIKKSPSTPKSSKPIIVHAIGVLVAPENTATNPIPANRAIGNGINIDKALPKVAPIKNSGVTSPPLNPAASVNAVKAILIKKSAGGRGFWNDSKIVGIPKPIYFVVPIANTTKAIIIPAKKGLKGGNFIKFTKSWVNNFTDLEKVNAAKPNIAPANIDQRIPAKLMAGTKDKS